MISKLSFISHPFIYHLPTIFNNTHPELITFLWCFFRFRFRFIILNLLFFNVDEQIRFLSTVTTFLIPTHVITIFTIQRNAYRTFHNFIHRLITYNTLKLILFYSLSLNSFKYGLWHCHFNNLLLSNEFGDSNAIGLNFLLTVTKNRLCLRHFFNYEIGLSLMRT